ncbi:VOC family protein [Congregibacter sp.]|uniref:VOC family protein n=1 Tax=Congregibacter sp. TaxID=2744308 RepID=UPI003F6C40F1
MHRPFAFVAGLVLTACSSIQYNLPPVASETDGERRAGKFIWHDLISDDPAGTETFYGTLFGWEFRSLELLGASYWVISIEGKPIGGMVDQSGLPAQRDISQWMSVLSVPDASEAVTIVREAGGQVLREPLSIGDRGTIAVFADAQGAHFATLTTVTGDPLDDEVLPPEGAFLWHELWTSDVPDAARFYAQLGDLDASAGDGEADAIDYRLLRSGDVTRGGIRSLPQSDMPSLWMPYLRVETLARLEALLAAVPTLGGEVLVSTVARPAGGHVAVIAGPSGAPIALQTWGDDQSLIEDI